MLPQSSVNNKNNEFVNRWDLISEAINLSVIYADESILVIEKPPHLNSIPSPNTEISVLTFESSSFTNAMKDQDEDPVKLVDEDKDKMNEKNKGNCFVSVNSVNTKGKKRKRQDKWESSISEVSSVDLFPDEENRNGYDAQILDQCKDLLNVLSKNPIGIPRKRSKFIDFMIRKFNYAEYKRKRNKIINTNSKTNEEIIQKGDKAKEKNNYSEECYNLTYEALLKNFHSKVGSPCDSVLTRVLKYYDDVWIVHRLDMETSGLLVIALTKQSANILSTQFHSTNYNANNVDNDLSRTAKNDMDANRFKIEKEYVALVSGLLHYDVKKDRNDNSYDQIEYCIEEKIRPHPDMNLVQIVDPLHGKEAKTLYKILEYNTNPAETLVTEEGIDNGNKEKNERKGHLGFTTKVLLKPITGRTHQLRVHMQFLGHPIVDDLIYSTVKSLDHENGDCPDPKSDIIKSNVNEAVPRLCLHAHKLTLMHPITNKIMTFTSKIPF